MKISLKGGMGGTVTSDDITATSSEVRSGFTVITRDSDDEIVNGTMPDNGAVSDTLNCGEYYDIPLGYHNGQGRITANSLSSQTQGDAIASDIKLNKTAWVNGQQVIGTIPIQTSTTTTLACAQSYTIPEGYHDGSGVVKVETLASRTSGTATTNSVLQGCTVWVNGNKIVGSRGIS